MSGAVSTDPMTMIEARRSAMDVMSGRGANVSVRGQDMDYGLRPVAEVEFADCVYPASDPIDSEAGLRYRSAGDFTAPITLRMPCGGGIYGGQTHNQRPEALFTTMASTSSRPRSNA